MTTQGRASRIVIHYSATYPDQHVTAEIVDGWHRQRGFSGIGYHWLIRRDGTVEQGRPEGQVGAHVRGNNTRSIGICWAGGLDRATGPNHGVWNPTPVQEAALVRLVREVLARHPGAEVMGHRDLVATQCPGADVRAWWAKVNAPAPEMPPERLSFRGWLTDLFRRMKR